MAMIRVFELKDPARQNPFDPPLPETPAPLIGRPFGSYSIIIENGEVDWHGPYPSNKAAFEFAYLRFIGVLP